MTSPCSKQLHDNDARLSGRCGIAATAGPLTLMCDPNPDSNACRKRLGLLLARVLLLALIVGASATRANAGGILWIQWDPSPDPAVIGYRVSIGPAPGLYTATFDVGPATSFLYSAPEDRRYFVTVASYAAGPIVGPRSAPVSGFPSAAPDAQFFYQAMWGSVATRASANSFRAEAEGVSRRPLAVSGPAMPPVLCWMPSSDCLAARTLARRPDAVSSIAASTDGRVFFVEGNQRIGALSGGAGPQIILAAGSGAVQFDQISLDAAFQSTGLLYVGETETGSDGGREFRVVRYRVAQNGAGERSVLVSLPLPASGRAQFSVGQGHIDVAVPVPAIGEPDRYAGTVLRFNLDGSVAGTASRGSAADTPVIAMGFSSPTGMTVDNQTGRLWLAGTDIRNRHWVSSVGGFATPLPVAATSLSAGNGAGGYLFFVRADGSLGKARTTRDGLATLERRLSFGNGPVRAVAASPSGVLFVAVADDPGAGAPTSILQLNPIW